MVVLFGGGDLKDDGHLGIEASLPLSGVVGLGVEYALVNPGLQFVVDGEQLRTRSGIRN